MTTHPDGAASASKKLAEAAKWAGQRSLRSGRPTGPDERPHDLADVADGVTVRVGVFDIVLW